MKRKKGKHGKEKSNHQMAVHDNSLLAGLPVTISEYNTRDHSISRSFLTMSIV